MPLFEVAILQKPTKKEAEEGGVEKLLFGPKAAIAKDSSSAGIAAVLAAQKDNAGVADLDMNRAEVIVRPFAP